MMHHSAKVVLLLICLTSAIISIVFAQPIHRTFSGFHGYKSHVSLQIPGESLDSDTPALIMPAFAGCTDTCPANLMLVREILHGSAHPLNLVVLSVDAEADPSTYLSRVANVTQQQPNLLDGKHANTWSLLAKFEQIQNHLNKSPTHAGHLYVYQASTQTLLTYITPDSKQIMEDLSQLTLGANDG